MGSELQSQQLVSKFDEEEVPVGSVILIGLPLEYLLLCCSVCSEFFQRVETQQCHSCSACACMRLLWPLLLHKDIRKATQVSDTAYFLL